MEEKGSSARRNSKVLLSPRGGCCGSCGAEVSGELVVQFLVLGSQPTDLVAVGPQLLAERVVPLGGLLA